ncbi:hypothetical protein RND71_022357 [Anisodus tanguticus]|uniref:DUF4283 domain-containing protein n=1 Tax=Anisodus tanguticus TaxID=243964 RepID=A0AAE1RTJ6_9SOLA|nr:hypothetical protein RND71_022357 [Anisodus tanguticus]
MVEQQDLKYVVVGKFSHGMPSIAFLRTAIPKQCSLKAEVNIRLLHNRHVLIRCSIEEDYVNLMSRPNFWIKENSKSFFMRTFKWDISFTPEEETSMAVIWLSFPNLPPNFYVPSILFSIASAVGKPIAIDAATLNKTRPSCDRVKVEADLLQEHPQKYNIQLMNGEEMETISYKIRYDFLSKYCSTCMLQGHDLQGCWKEHPELQPERRLDGDGTVAVAAKGKITNPTPLSTNPSRQNPNPKPLPTATNPTQEWTTVTHKRKYQNQQKQPLEALENTIPMTETVNPENLNIGNNPPSSKQPLLTQILTKIGVLTPETVIPATLDAGNIASTSKQPLPVENSPENPIGNHPSIPAVTLNHNTAYQNPNPKPGCGLKADVRIGLLCDRHVLIRCTIVEDFDTLMSKQTFEIKEKNKPYLMRTFKWDVSFNPAEESRFAYGWISFLGLSPHYYGESTLFSMAAAVGTPIAVDAATLNKTRPSCARVKVEFDLLKNHPQHVVIQVGEGDGITTELQKIRYDFKPKYCTNCKL